MSCCPAAIEQTCSSKQHCAGANRTDSPDPSGDLSQPAHDVTVYFILLDRAATSDKKSVDLSTHFSKSFMCGDSQSTVRHKRSLRRRADDFDGIDWRRSGVLFAKHFRSASKDLQRPDQIDDLCPRRGHEHDPPRFGPRRTATISELGHSFLLLVIRSVRLGLTAFYRRSRTCPGPRRKSSYRRRSRSNKSCLCRQTLERSLDRHPFRTQDRVDVQRWIQVRSRKPDLNPDLSSLAPDIPCCRRSSAQSRDRSSVQPHEARDQCRRKARRR